MHTKIVSIIIPCYNNENSLPEMINCIIRQTYNLWELVIVDDQSTDNSQCIIKEYVNKDTRIKMFVRDRQPKGSTTCRNIGFENSLGQYVIHFDADDLISDTCLEKRVAFMEANPEIDYASFPAKMWHVDILKVPKFTDWGKTWGIGKNNMNLLRSFLRSDYPFSVWNNIYKRDSIKNLYWDENVKIYTDFSFIIPGIITRLRHRFSGLLEIDYFYRIYNNANNMCSSFVSEEKHESTKYLIDKTLQILRGTENFNKYKQDFLYFIRLHYVRLLLSRDDVKINNFINFCSHYYSKFTITQLHILKFIVLMIKNQVLCQSILNLICIVWFVNKRYINILKINLQSKYRYIRKKKL